MKKLIILLFLVAACNADPSGNLPDPEPIQTEQLKNITIDGLNVSFETINTIPEPCWELADYESSISNSEVVITIFGQRTTTDPCMQVVSSLEANVEITLPQNGTYTFKFFRYEGETLDTTLTVD
ncbi:MAG: hypothetical protein U5J95_03915 [Balneolaceae bacterium]|nr:hypothetical protein [Balneolaceae bacterium]